MKSAVAILAACCMGVGAFALRAGAAPQQEQPAASFKAGVQLVRLDVRVTDDQGRPVRDLKQSEVQVVEDGQERPVLFFQHVAEPTEPFLEAVKHTVAGEVSTNQGAVRGHLFVMIFDQLHIRIGEEQRARLAAQQFIRTRLRPGDRVAVYGIPGPGPELSFTGDPARAIAALQQVRGQAQAQETGVSGAISQYEAYEITRGDEKLLQSVVQRLQEEFGLTDTGPRNASAAADKTSADSVKEDAQGIVDRLDGQSRRVLSMLSDILRPMRAIEGRKTVFLISDGFNGDHLSREIDNVAAAAAESYSVIDAIDLNSRVVDASAERPSGGDAANAVADKISSLGGLALQTDGALIPDAGIRAQQVFTQLADQSQDYYLVGFTPLDRDLKDPGAYRRVTVRVSRSGARVSTRTGFALADASATVNRRMSIDRAMAAPFPQQGLPVRYTTYVMRSDTAGVERVIVSLAAELPLASEKQSHPADVVFVVRNAADGRVAASGTDVIPLPRSETPGETTGLGSYRVQFDVPPGDYLMRAVVHEPGGLVGSADRRFTVRALDGPSVTSGDLVLSAARGELPVRPAAYAGDGLSGVLELYGRTSDQLSSARVVVDLVPVGESTPAVSGFAELQPVQEAGSGVEREARMELPLTGVTPGAYVARATVKVGQDTVSQVVREVEVRQGERPRAADETIASAFDPHDLVNGAFARDYVGRTGADPSPSPAATRQGLTRLAAADYPGAIALFAKALDADAKNAPAAFFLGWAYHGAGDDRQAISAWRRAAYLDPTLIPAHLALADMYVKLAQPALALQALRAGLAAAPASVELQNRLAQIERGGR